MTTTEIPPDAWTRFCRDFTLQHRGWLATVVLRMGGHSALIVRDGVFEGLSVEQDGPHSTLILSMGRGAEHLTHRVPAPRSLALEMTEGGAHTGLSITAEDNAVTTVGFRTPARPDTLDGVTDPGPAGT